MIGKSTRIQTESGPRNLVNHIFDKHHENEEINVLQGSREEVCQAFDIASGMSKKYAVRHFTLSSQEPLNTQQTYKMFRMFGDEYGFSSDNSTIVEHRKQRENHAGWEYHYHLLEPEIQDNGKVLDNRASRLRNEKVCRRFEIEEGLKIIPGKWNHAVAKAFRAEGLYEYADKMSDACAIERPRASYSSGKLQEMKRKGKSMPHIKTDINNIWSQSDGIKAFLSAMSDSGFRIEQGTKNKKSYIIYDEDNTQIGSVSRILKDVRQNDFFIMMEDFNNEIIRKEEKTAVRQSTKKAVGGLIKKSTKQEADDYADQGLESFPEFPVFRAEEENGNAESDLLRSEISPRGNIADSGTDTENTNGRAEPDRADTREPESDITEPAGINESNIRHAQHVVASAKIKFHFSNTVEIRDISHVRPITPEYIQEIKERVKSYGKDDKEYFFRHL
ncbi:hypothetical protein A0U92_07295 [Acetobacter aceti]|uniref:Relaxase n=1 Tax=Acetobacter aceti TaxID=435 RepID=A0A1U9KFW5_ACEAC|nr:relaxase/mobilization nuclease domain-containing protein [Acetobacter aceti]AQS84617.1 hypothetical protein A0U92_07295 [Acetobacter aceti]